jgi:arylsulfatase A-like enzyme
VVPGVTKPGTVCDRTVDFMSIYPTLCDLTGLPVPGHVESKSLRALLRDPASGWDRPAVTTHGFQNHAVRSESWRYIRYADGSEELYDETKDPYEWVNLAEEPSMTSVKAELSRWLPETNVPSPPRNRPAARAAQGRANAAEADDESGETKPEP